MNLSEFTTEQLIDELINRDFIRYFWQKDDIRGNLEESEQEFTEEDINAIAVMLEDVDAAIGLGHDSINDCATIHFATKHESC